MTEAITRRTARHHVTPARAAVGLTLAATLLMIGCSSETGPADESTGDQPEQAQESAGALDSAGHHCMATCKGYWTYRYCNYGITSGCHDWAVNKCHSNGLSFVDAAWTYWGCS